MHLSSSTVTFAVFSEVSEVVGTVNEEIGVVLLRDLLVVNEVRRVSIHGEEALCYDEDGVVRVFLACFL